MGLVEDFERIIEEAEQLEEFSIPMRLKRRIANAYARAVEKCLVLKWYDEDVTDPERMNRTIQRHAERGVRDFLP